VPGLHLLVVELLGDFYLLMVVDKMVAVADDMLRNVVVDVVRIVVA
jgi:hypothetical protein